VEYELRSITSDELAAFRMATSIGFGEDAEPDGDERFLSTMSLDRTIAAFDGSEIVGTFGDFSLKLTVPGGAQLATAGTTMVTVQATHTRRGILRAMMHKHLAMVAARGEPVAALWASEPAIYGRFGFGLATEYHKVSIDSRMIAAIKAASDVEVRTLLGSDLSTVVAPFWSKVAGQRSGFIDRSEARWDDIAADPEHRREGGTAGRQLVARRDGEVVGYAAYRQKSEWTPFGMPEGVVKLQTLVAEDIDAHLALWAQVLDIDLFPVVESWNSATDDPLTYSVSNSRAVHRAVGDGLFVRILDLETALTSRTYEADGEIVLAVEDDLGYAEGTYRLTIADGRATVEPSSDSPDVTMDVRELGALYLGRVCSDLYASTGLIRGSDKAVRLVGQLFATARAPWCPEMF